MGGRRWVWMGGIAFAVVAAGMMSVAGADQSGPACAFAWEPTIVGTEDDDVLYGTSGADVIDGLGGNDIIFGLGGDDCIDGGAGDDLIRAGAGDDFLMGGHGNDRLRGGDGHDLLFGSDITREDPTPNGMHGGPGNDALWGSAGPDRIFGGDGNDQLLGWGENDAIFGGSGRDFIEGHDGSDRVLAGRQNDVVYGGAGNDVLIGEAGDDWLDGEDGTGDVLVGRGGEDRCVDSEDRGSAPGDGVRRADCYTCDLEGYGWDCGEPAVPVTNCIEELHLETWWRCTVELANTAPYEVYSNGWVDFFDGEGNQLAERGTQGYGAAFGEAGTVLSYEYLAPPGTVEIRFTSLSFEPR